MRVIWALCALLLAPVAALAQGSVLQAGPPTSNHAPMYSPGSSFQTVIQDSGPASGGLAGLGLSELLQVNRSPTTSTGTGPLGTHNCDYSTTVKSGAYYFLCFDANAQGGGLIAYGHGGTAPAEPLTLNINGASFTLPGSASCIGCGTLAGQSANNVAITGGAISGTAITGGTITGAAITGGTISGVTFPTGVVSGGTTFAVSGCTPSTLTGGATAGTFVSGGSGTCTATITMGASATAPHGWACPGNVLGTTNPLIQTAYSTTTAAVLASVSPGQTIIFSCQGF
jgi:hypothetical protein